MRTGRSGVLDGPATDVVVVGYGPAGQVLAALLGASGHDVTVLESRPGPYRLPRAAHLDGQTMRTLQAVGVAESLEPRFHRQRGYEFYSAAGELMHRLDFTGADPSGWAGGYFFFGPDLESALDSAVHRSAGVDVRRGHRVNGLTQHEERVRVDVLNADTDLTTTLSARYVVGADGANSTVRELAGIGWANLGFEAEWLVVDIAPRDGDVTHLLPEAAQILDPVRPVSTFRWVGTEHARLEFMVLAGESAQDLTDETRVWNLLRPWDLRPDNCALIRRAVYTFRSRLADTFNQGRVLLTGDAAHLMPPFLGQGMCSGIRDAAALAWRLDRALSSDLPTDRLFGSYTAERRAHVGTVIEGSIAVGRILGATADTVGRPRSADALRAALAALPAQLPDLTCGGIAVGHLLAGTVFPQELSPLRVDRPVVSTASRAGDGRSSPRWICHRTSRRR